MDEDLLFKKVEWILGTLPSMWKSFSFPSIGGYREVLEIIHRHTKGALILGALEVPCWSCWGPITPVYMAPNAIESKKKYLYFRILYLKRSHKQLTLDRCSEMFHYTRTSVALFSM